MTKLVKFRMRTNYTNISLFGYVNRINTKELDTQVDTSEIKHIKQLFWQTLYLPLCQRKDGGNEFETTTKACSAVIYPRVRFSINLPLCGFFVNAIHSWNSGIRLGFSNEDPLPVVFVCKIDNMSGFRSGLDTFMLCFCWSRKRVVWMVITKILETCEDGIQLRDYTV